MGKNRHKFKSLKERINDIEVKVFRSLDKVKSEPSKARRVTSTECFDFHLRVNFLSRLANSLVTLLKNGGQEDPEIIEQIFESWSYIVRDLQKYFICDIKTILKVTLELRYYPKDYIIELMSPSMSFLLRTAPDKQLEKGSGSTVEVVSSTLERICKDYKVEELSVIWNCLYQEVNKSILNKQSVHLSRLLTVITSAVRIKKGLKVHGKLLYC
ncbi:hypothetical protein ARALYDRAFT_342733 [Arabidopsis lyrata subsp. lyrata]|uniref:Uncharacterized protein n=1 Tax=Arabidopsis lyrata subsp. lyrata TaxID=81972 RepID=D7L7C8_ARALL|nr:hypothetical protein ARALYDRAFT_342733 [Arabidopsis lyrata subsp. lyrata]